MDSITMPCSTCTTKERWNEQWVGRPALLGGDGAVGESEPLSEKASKAGGGRLDFRGGPPSVMTQSSMENSGSFSQEPSMGEGPP